MLAMRSSISGERSIASKLIAKSIPSGNAGPFRKRWMSAMSPWSCISSKWMLATSFKFSASDSCIEPKHSATALTWVGRLAVMTSKSNRIILNALS